MTPDGWEKYLLKDVAEIKRGAGSQYLNYIEEITNESIRLIRISDFLGDKPKFVRKTKDIERFILKDGDILIAGTGATAGIVFEVPDDFAGMAFSYNAPRIRTNDKVCKKFVTYYLKSRQILKQQNSLFTGNAQPFLDTRAIGGFRLHIPPLPEQRKIAKILSTWDKAISTTERLIDNSKQQKKALMQQLLTGKKRLLDDSGRVFEGDWERRLFKEVLRLDRGSSPRPIVNFITEDNDGVNWIKIGDTRNDTSYISSTKEKITLEGAKKSRQVSIGEVIVSNSMSYGKPYILKIDGYIHDGWFVLRDYEKYMDVSFLIQVLSSEFVQAQYKRLAAGGVVTNISSELVYAVKVNLPKINEQQKIASVLTAADKEIQLLEQQLANLKQEKKALMQQLLTGKHRVKSDDTAVA